MKATLHSFSYNKRKTVRWTWEEKNNFFFKFLYKKKKRERDMNPPRVYMLLREDSHPAFEFSVFWFFQLPCGMGSLVTGHSDWEMK